MAIIRYRPNDIFSNLQEEMNKLFDSRLIGIENDKSTSALSAWKPNVDIKENGDKYTVIAALPGVDIKDIKVSMMHNTLTIQGERKYESDTKTEDYHRIERFTGTFYREFTLPDKVDVNKISAKCKNGVLELSIPKMEKANSTLIEIKSTD